MKKFKKLMSILLAAVISIPYFANIAVSAEGTEKYPYMIFGRNGITMSASSNLCMNGNVHTNKEADISYLNGNINGKITSGADIEKRVKHVYADTKIRETYFTENCELYEDGYVRDEMNIHINNPIYSYRNIELDGNVALNSSMGTLMDINVTGEVKNANTSVVYSKYGDITIENDSTANINGLIYCPLGTLTIDSPNINLNGVIIADKIVINGGSVNINYKDDIAGFIGTESEYYDFSDLEYLPESWLGDTDEDMLFDIYEKVIDTDPYDIDTDDDGLPDGYEVLTLNTDPLELDTDENGISDADEDFDNDNLNNLGEYLNKTGPFNPDTDEDGLLDGDEIKTYGTDPLNPDTDNDKLLDGEEGYDGTIYKKYGVYFDPLNPDTNGNGILDGDEVYTQSKNQSVETYDKAITEIKVDMDTNGSLERNLTIESMYGIDAMSSDVYAMIGEPFNFTSETSFESATITFKIDKSKLGDTKFDNLIILWYNEEKQIFEEMPTTRNWENSTVSATTTHFSQYMIVDSEKWYDNWEESFMELRKMWSSHTTYYKAMNTILVVDCSWKMDSADPISYSIEVGYNGVTEENHTEILSHIQGSQSNIDYYMEKYGRRKCSRAYICENIIGNMGSGDSAAVIMYSDHIESNTGLTGSTGSLYSAVQGVNSDGNSLWLDSAVQTALSYVSDSDSEMYRIIVLTNGDVSYGYELSSYDYTNVSLNIVSLGGGSVGSNLEKIVYDSHGDVYYGYPSSDLTNVTGNTIELPPQFEGEDSDGDGIPDLVELYGLKPDGHPINTDPFKKDTDGDGLDDNIELNFVTEKLTSAVSMVEYYSAIGYSSDPTMMDTDNDGLDDKEEYNLGTNPRLSDTDGDGILDGDDVYPLTPYILGKARFWEFASYNIKVNKWEAAPSFADVESASEVSAIIQRFYSNTAIENAANFDYINNQNEAPVSNIKYGYKYTMEHNGCELIAIYNALKLKNNYQALSEIALEFEANGGMAMDTRLLSTHPSFSSIPSTQLGIILKSGFFGSNPFYIKQYLNAHKYKNEQTESLSELQSWAKPGRVFIMSYWNNKDDIGRGLHTIAVRVNLDKTINTYNNGVRNNFDDFIDLINRENGSFITGYYLC